jgi:hypothetical protein
MPPHLNKLLCIAIYAFILLAGESLCLATGRAPGAPELKRAEKVLAKLAELQTSSADPDSYKRAVGKFYPELFINVSSLPEGDLKTDLSTAAFLYQKAYGFERGGEMADCDNEVRGLYKNLCLRRSNPTRAQLLLAKAQLHTGWAEALVRFYRGNTDASTVATVSEIKTERSIDLKLAERVVSILKTLDEEVNSYSSLPEFEEHNAVARVSFDKLSNDFEVVGARAQQLLSSMPRNLLYYHLQNALNSYSDGLFWWEKTHTHGEASSLVVSANNWTEPASKKPLGFDVETINYTVVSNWRKAGKQIANAASEIEKARNDRSGEYALSKF